LGTQCSGRSKRWWQPTMEIIWDLFVFLVLVAVGLIVLNLLARTR
jgi:hypothetical protein